MAGVIGNQKQERIIWIDNVKAFAIWCVAVSHCFHFFSSAPYEAFAIRPFVNAFNMHLFFFIAGITSIRGLRKITDINALFGYLHKLIWRISVPCFMYSIITRLVGGGGINTKSVFYVIVLLLFSIYSYFAVIRKTDFKYMRFVVDFLLFFFTLSSFSGWFFQSFFITMIVMAFSIFIFNIAFHEESKYNRILSAVLFFAIMFLIPVKATSEMAPIYFIGTLLQKKLYGFKLKGSHQMLLSLLFLVIGLLFFRLAYYNGMPANEVTFYENSFFDLFSSGDWWRYIFRQICAMSLVGSFVLFIMLISNNFNKISWLGSKTLPIYCIHGIILIGFNTYFPVIDIKNQFLFFFCSVCLGTIILFVSCVFVSLFTKTQLTKTLLLGEKL